MRHLGLTRTSNLRDTIVREARRRSRGRSDGVTVRMRRVDAIDAMLKFNRRCVGLPVEVRTFTYTSISHGLHDVARVHVDDGQRSHRRPLI